MGPDFFLESNPEYVDYMSRWRSEQKVPNKNYNAGRRFEWKRRDHWRSMGHDVMRTAGSHGPFDLITVSGGGDVQFIQCKIVGTTSEAERLIKNFLLDLPFGHRERTKFHQVIEVHVKELKDVMTSRF